MHRCPFNTRPVNRWSALCAVLLTGVLSACAGEPASLPALPEVSVDGVLPAVREQLVSAYEAVLDSPTDAAKNGDYAMVLHAYDRSEHANLLYQRARVLAPKDPRWPFYQSAVLQRLGDLEGSLVALDTALSLSPGHIDVLAKRGEALFLLGRQDDAKAQLDEVIEKNPSYPLAQFYLARLHVERQEWQAAVDKFEELLARGLNVRDLHQNLGVAHRMLGDTDEAQKHLDIAARDQGLFIKSYDPINMVIARLNEGDQPHLLKARELYVRGNLEAAKTELLTAVNKNPTSLGAHLHLTRIFAEQKNVDGARRHYNEVMDIEPTNAVAHASWGLALSNTGQHDAALAAYRQAAQGDPGNHQYRVATATVLGRLGRHEDALAETDAALKLAPDSRNARYLRGHSLLALKRYDEALADLTQVRLPEDGRTPLVLRGIAIAQHNLGHPDMALQQFEAAVAVARKQKNQPLIDSLERELQRLRGSAN